MKNVTTLLLRFLILLSLFLFLTAGFSFTQSNFSITLQMETNPFFTPDHAVGLATISYMPGPQDMFLSIGAQQQTGPLDIIVSNLLLPSNMYGSGQRTVSTQFNLDRLRSPGQETIPMGTPIITYFHIFHSPICYPFDPSTYVYNALVTLQYFNMYAIGLESVLNPITNYQMILPPETPCIPNFALEDKVVRTDVPNLDLDKSTHGISETFAGDENACAPTSTANSMKWVETHYSSVDLKGKSLRQVMEELSHLFKRKNGEGTYTDSMIIGKMDFMEANNIPMEVKFQSFFTKNNNTLKSSSGKSTARNFNKDTGNVPPDYNFIKQMLKDGEDVEMNFTWYNAADDKWYGHSVVLTGYQEYNNGKKVISFNSDDDQDHTGGTVNETDTIFVDSTGWMRFGPNNKYFIKDVIAESPIPTFGQATAAWLNEFFPISGGKNNKSKTILYASDEFIEIAANQNIPDLEKYKVTLYDQSTGKQYMVLTLDQFTPGATMDSFKVYTKSFSGNVIHDVAGGISLSYSGSPITGLFISYGGAFTAMDGDWTGLTSTDIGIVPTPGNSIALVGAGTQFSSFTWMSTNNPTPGLFNTGQETPVELGSFNASVNKEGILLKWSTASEINNNGFEIERSEIGKDVVKNTKAGEFRKIGFVKGSGSTTEGNYYSYIDKTAPFGKLQYRLKQIDFDGASKYSNIIEVDNESKLTFNLAQNYPNPFNPVTAITYTIPENAHVQLIIYDILGKQVELLVNENQERGVYKVDFKGDNLNSGIYFYQLLSGNKIITKKMILIK